MQLYVVRSCHFETLIKYILYIYKNWNLCFFLATGRRVLTPKCQIFFVVPSFSNNSLNKNVSFGQLSLWGNENETFAVGVFPS